MVTTPIISARRSQEDRRRATSKKLIEATIAVVIEKGYSGLKSSTIAERAGVTWGAVQHLFGEKQALLLTVANQTYEELSSALGANVSHSASLEEKVDELISVTWRIYKSDAYLAMVEILRGSRSDPTFNKKVRSRQQAVNEDVRKAWLDLFSNDPIDPDLIDEAREFVTVTLSGLAARRIFLKRISEPDEIFERLKQVALSILSNTS
ncbi:MAG: TetR/AcrR family transcriptional regulator [Pseudomonadota bacterium]